LLVSRIGDPEVYASSAPANALQTNSEDQGFGTFVIHFGKIED
jgi:hypothetical protein